MVLMRMKVFVSNLIQKITLLTFNVIDEYKSLECSKKMDSQTLVWLNSPGDPIGNDLLFFHS